MKTQITITSDGEAFAVKVQVIVAGHALLDFTSIIEADEPKELMRERFTAQIPQYEATAKAKALAIFKELIG